MSFNVTPIKDSGREIHGYTPENVYLTFRIPMDRETTLKYANVKHEGQDFGQYEVKTDSDGNKYISFF